MVRLRKSLATCAARVETFVRGGALDSVNAQPAASCDN